jgi:hypothetical protein
MDSILRISSGRSASNKETDDIVGDLNKEHLSIQKAKKMVKAND